MSTSSRAEPYKGQSYSKLRRRCVRKNKLFVDGEFPPTGSSLFFSRQPPADIIWKRPKDIVQSPRFFIDKASADDFSQGTLGNCWFVAACACIAEDSSLWKKVVPDYRSQEWSPNVKYAGIFHFKFWRCGRWADVVIDDYLPTRNGRLIFTHSKTRNEFWSALLEKAYAKLFGNYESLDGGELSEALEDFTGGVSDTLDLLKMEVATKAEERVSLFARMEKEMDRRSLMAASIPATSADEMEACTDVGLVKGHAYGITAVKNVHLEGSGLFGIFNREKLPMIRLRNPWGQCEWKGAFSDGSPEWDKIDQNDRKKVGLVFEEDGEFWMTFEDFCKYFHQTAICRVVNTSFFSLNKMWHEGLAHGAWKPPNRAGGCPNHKETFLKNPQYAFDVGDDEEFMAQLMQKSTRDKEGSINKTIGFTVLRVELNRRHRIHDLTLQERTTSTVYRDSRSIFLRYGSLKKGRYVIVPSTFDPNQEAEFLLRVYTSAANNFMELTHDVPAKSWWNCCAKDPTMVTQIKVVKAVGLEKQDVQGADPYCVISCEGEKVTTHVVSNTTNPEWGDSAVFFRKTPLKSPIKVQIWNNNVLRDQYMGKHVFMSTDDFHNSAQEVNLFGRKNESSVQKPGKLLVYITQSRQLTSI